MAFWDTVGKVAKATGSVLQEASEQRERRMREKVRTLSDSHVLRAIDHAEEQFARNLAYEEAQRRGLL